MHGRQSRENDRQSHKNKLFLLAEAEKSRAGLLADLTLAAIGITAIGIGQAGQPIVLTFYLQCDVLTLLTAAIPITAIGIGQAGQPIVLTLHGRVMYSPYLRPPANKKAPRPSWRPWCFFNRV